MSRAPERASRGPDEQVVRRGRRTSSEARWLCVVSSGADASLWPNGDPLDGRRLIELASRHRLAARVGGRMALADDVPETAWGREFLRVWRVGLGEDALVRDTLAALGAEAVARGLPLAALKGADLARRVYGAGERPANDIDLLTIPVRLDDAVAALEGAGFACDHPDPAFARRHWFALTFRSAARPRLQVDLHWALGPRWRTRWDLAAVMARGESLPGTPGVMRLCAEDLGAHLALHAVAFHGGAVEWLRWLDLWLLVAGRPVLAEQCRLRAAEVGGAVAWAAAMVRTDQLFAQDAATEAGDTIRTPSPVSLAGPRAQLAAALGRFQEDRAPRRFGRWLVGALAVDRPQDLIRAATTVALRPLRSKRGKPR